MQAEESTPHVAPAGGGSSWTPQVEELLEDWHHRVYAAQTAHYASADLFRTLNYIVGVPAVMPMVSVRMCCRSRARWLTSISRTCRRRPDRCSCIV